MSGQLRFGCSPSHLGVSEIRLKPDCAKVELHVLVEGSRIPSDLQIELWYKNDTAKDWSAQAFTRTKESDDKEETVTNQANYLLDYNVSGEHIIDFTVRYRETEHQEWIWLAKPGQDGRLLLIKEHMRRFEGLDFRNMFSGSDRAIFVEDTRSSVHDTMLQVISATAKAVAPEYTETCLGTPNSLVQWVSLERLMSFWMEPNQGRDKLNTQRDSFLVAFQRDDGLHVVLLPLGGLKNDCHVYLRTDQETEKLTMLTKNDGEHTAEGQIVVGSGTTLKDTLDAVFDHARKMFQDDSFAAQENAASSQGIDAKWFEDWTDGLFYCTWNAMYTDVTEQKLFEAMAGLDKQGIRVNGVIIDDGWQDIDDKRRWKAFSPTEEKFPHGLGGFVKELKRRYPYIKHVGVWHALMGYWNGFAPNSWISDNYALEKVAMRKITVPHGLEEMHIVSACDIRQMYGDFYKYLADEGITVVKCDVQAAPDDISHAWPKARRVWRDYQDAFKLASLQYFDRKVIYCMSHVSDILLYSLLQKNMPPACLRNSNDFFPNEPKSHAWHIFWNASNALYTSRLNCLPDWDMFDTTHPQAVFHAHSRSMSGGPILITDRVERSDCDLVQRMTSRSISTGATRVIRFQTPALSRYPYLNFHDGRCTKVINRTYDLFCLGLFNTTSAEVHEAVILDDIVTTSTDKGEYVVTEFSTQAVARTKTSERVRPLFLTSLAENTSELYTASPVMAMTEAKSCAVIGLLDKFAGAVGVNWYRVNHSHHPILEVQVAHLGILGIYLDFPVIVDSLLVTMREIVVPRETVYFEAGILKLDLLAAWKQMELLGWSNEINVKFYFR